MQRLIKCSSFRVQIKDSGLTKGVDDETSLFLAVRVSFRVHSKKYQLKETLLLNFCFQA